MIKVGMSLTTGKIHTMTLCHSGSWIVKLKTFSRDNRTGENFYGTGMPIIVTGDLGDYAPGDEVGFMGRIVPDRNDPTKVVMLARSDDMVVPDAWN